MFINKQSYDGFSYIFVSFLFIYLSLFFLSALILWFFVGFDLLILGCGSSVCLFPLLGSKLFLFAPKRLSFRLCRAQTRVYSTLARLNAC